MADDEGESKITNVAEILPDNPRTDVILKKRAEDEEIRRQKHEELRAIKEKEEKNKKLRERNEKAEVARR